MAGDSLQDQARALKPQLAPNRAEGRKPEAPRPIEIVPDCNMYAEGSALVKAGRTHVICTASLEERVPPFRRGMGQGWVTAEYGMLPRATGTRTTREATAGKASGRTAEIQRLIGRSLRAVVDMAVLGEHTVWVDCDVIQADGSTRTAAITGAFVALVLALRKLGARQSFRRPPVTRHVVAVSVGLVNEAVLLDLDYGEDQQAQVDLNVVMDDERRLIEIQGTAEEHPFPRPALERMLDLAEQGIAQRVAAQRAALGGRLL